MRLANREIGNCKVGVDKQREFSSSTKDQEKSKISGTLHLPKKPADPGKLDQLSRKVNERYGHIPSAGNERKPNKASRSLQ